MADEGMTMPAIRRIIELEQQLAEVAAQRDELAARLQKFPRNERGLLTGSTLCSAESAGIVPTKKNRTKPR